MTEPQDAPAPLTADEREALRNQIVAMQAANQGLVAQVSRARVMNQQQPVNWAFQELSIRLAVLVEGVLGKDTDDELRYEHAVHATFAQAAAQLAKLGEKASARDTLLQGVPGVRP